jgi:hypothetical protein
MFAPQSHDNPHWLLDSIGFFNPVIGLLMFVALKRDTPRKAQSILRASVIGIIAIPAAFLLTFVVMWLLKLLGTM